MTLLEVNFRLLQSTSVIDFLFLINHALKLPQCSLKPLIQFTEPINLAHHHKQSELSVERTNSARLDNLFSLSRGHVEYLQIRIATMASAL